MKGRIGEKIEYCSNQYEALDGADALLIATEWPVFRTPDFEKVKSKLNESVIFDGRNLYDLTNMRDNEFYYESVGRTIVQ